MDMLLSLALALLVGTALWMVLIAIIKKVFSALLWVIGKILYVLFLPVILLFRWIKQSMARLAY
jgi:hypothetical protein